MKRMFSHLSKGVLGLVLVVAILALGCEKKYHILRIINNYPYELEVVIGYQDSSGNWRTSGSWMIPHKGGGQYSKWAITDNGENILSNSGIFYFFTRKAQDFDNKYPFADPIPESEYGQLPMKKAELSVNSDGYYDLVFNPPPTPKSPTTKKDTSGSSGGFIVFLLVVGLIGLAIYHLSPAGGYRNGFQDGSEGKSEGFFYRHMAGEATKEAYRRGYHDGQMKRIGDK